MSSAFSTVHGQRPFLERKPSEGRMDGRVLHQVWRIHGLRRSVLQALRSTSPIQCRKPLRSLDASPVRAIRLLARVRPSVLPDRRPVHRWSVRFLPNAEIGLGPVCLGLRRKNRISRTSPRNAAKSNSGSLVERVVLSRATDWNPKRDQAKGLCVGWRRPGWTIAENTGAPLKTAGV